MCGMKTTLMSSLKLRRPIKMSVREMIERQETAPEHCGRQCGMCRLIHSCIRHTHTYPRIAIHACISFCIQ